jgi:hypothetical protein
MLRSRSCSEPSERLSKGFYGLFPSSEPDSNVYAELQSWVVSLVVDLGLSLWKPIELLKLKLANFLGFKLVKLALKASSTSEASRESSSAFDFSSARVDSGSSFSVMSLKT